MVEEERETGTPGGFRDELSQHEVGTKPGGSCQDQMERHLLDPTETNDIDDNSHDDTCTTFLGNEYDMPDEGDERSWGPGNYTP